MPDPGEPFSQDYEALSADPAQPPDPDAYASYPDYLRAVDAHVARLLSQPGELDIRRESIKLQIKVEELLREAAGE